MKEIQQLRLRSELELPATYLMLTHKNDIYNSHIGIIISTLQYKNQIMLKHQLEFKRSQMQNTIVKVDNNSGWLWCG